MRGPGWTSGVRWWTLAALLGAACSDGTEAPVESLEAALTSTAAAPEDGLAEAYATFKQIFVGAGLDQSFPIGYGFDPVLSTEKVNPFAHRPKGTATLDLAAGKVNATLDDAPASGGFDLWFVKNVAGTGKTVAPESSDQLLKVGSFSGSGTHRTLSATANVKFDLDLVVVTRKGKSPVDSRVAVGQRTLFEKRLFREKLGKTLDPVSGTLFAAVESADPLVARGAQLFFNETFGGNGRTCGTCHRAEHNLTIDKDFIKGLPQSDPLFVSENNPALAGLEDKTALHDHALIRENLDGFDDPSTAVLRSVQHTFALGTTNRILTAIADVFPDNPPAQRLGWGGDGAPGRGTLHEFGLGAIHQHFPRTLNRKAGTDFRVPTQEELDALEAFQLFTGRGKLVDASVLVFREQKANDGSRELFSQGCDGCHRDLRGNPDNINLATGVNTIPLSLPDDDGFLGDREIDQQGQFNPPPLFEAADTFPFFHNNAAPDLDSAINFYVSDQFLSSPEGNNFDFNLPPEVRDQIAAFLRVLNAAENIRQVRKRVTFVRNHRGSGNTDILTIAMADTQDALNDLAAQGLNPTARNVLTDVAQTLFIARANADANRPGFMDHALAMLALAKGDLFTSNPNNDF
jgi:hypothetical protein